MYRVYVLVNPKGQRYIGLSEDVDERLERHNRGESRYTRRRGPWTLEWKSRQMDLGDARKLENRMKRQKGGNGLHTLMEIHGS